MRASGSVLVHLESQQSLRLDNYVGVIETPCGTHIEILPTHFDSGDDINRSRQLLVRMLEGALDLPERKIGPAALQTFNVPLTEWLMGRFLLTLDRVVKAGLRFIYHRIEEDQKFLRSRLQMERQIRRPPPSQNIAQDFRDWQHDRLMVHYEDVKPWCELILSEQVPIAVAGQWQGISLLFPMEKIFEQYVATCLRRKLANRAKVVAQAAREHLCHHKESDWFELRPDILISRGLRSWILDTKWKRLNQDLNTAKDKYGISQSDMYQMFAYGQRYLNGSGEMILIYPRTNNFFKTLPAFEFSNQLRLWAVAFDMEKGTIVSDGVPEELKPVVGLARWSDEVD